MVILHLADGTVKQLDPRRDEDLRVLDNIQFQKIVRRVAFDDGQGKRVDLPLNKNGIYRMWIERVEKKGELRGERFCMTSTVLVMTATLYYSDNRVVIDVNHSGGFRCFRREMSH